MSIVIEDHPMPFTSMGDEAEEIPSRLGQMSTQVLEVMAHKRQKNHLPVPKSAFRILVPACVGSNNGDDGGARFLIDYLAKRIGTIHEWIMIEEKAVPFDDLNEFVWKTTRQIRESINPESGPHSTRNWNYTKQMLEEVVDFTRFSPLRNNTSCIFQITDREVLQCFVSYRAYLMTAPIPREVQSDQQQSYVPGYVPYFPLTVHL